MKIFEWKIVGCAVALLLTTALPAENKEGPSFPSLRSWNQPSIDDISEHADKVEQKIDAMTENVHKGKTIQHPPLHRRVNYGMFLEPTLLYWQAMNHGFRYASENKLPQFTSFHSPSSNYVFHEVEYEWHPGVRIDAGYRSHYDDWDAWGSWTWYRSSDKGSVTANDFILDEAAHGLLPDFGGEFRFAKGHWRLNYNTGDIQMGRSYFLTKALAIEPFLGARTAFLYQSFRSYFSNLISDLDSILFPLNAKTSAHSNFWGFGPRTGCDLRWRALKTFGFDGLLSGALLYGKRMVKELLFETMHLANGTVTSLEKVHQGHTSYHTVIPTLQLALGLDWGKCFYQDRFFFGLEAAWEFNYWWDQFRTKVDPILTTKEPEEAIEIQGMNFRAIFCY